ncbi:2-hydroxy-6-oxo-6-(2'-aminophenyl)hexa-2, 4-dienoic acid hydrolase [Pigmentiphaga humi]|uniref:2-hydroxy-6-oxo-6-(2'-aminophenyl)hexa-2, 4-dienoic acid hydrolase n=1 Tax=Pigmentiphaga humi TaxID=2478468 RepID=A0A3P4B6Z2_9BURK|nr:alpha/beta hydrolase [Pigmentiphaga humi]VCU72053.1 2-hydroxy-6-oxo-6-(2'-aminophenyl)hexa-2, 4-dienoic acid hydrolase [Pigmentiphaga humi]
MAGAQSRTVVVDGVRTHYIEAGEGEPLVLIHGGEFGACAEISWEFNIGPLAEHYRVIAPDMLGYGRTEKIFSFENFWQKRVDHIAALLRLLGIEAAHFCGNSMGGTMILAEAANAGQSWPVGSVVSVCGGSPVNEAARQVLHTYDLTLEGMRAITGLLVQAPQLRGDEDYIRRRHELSLLPGAWEATAAPRFSAPNRPARLPRPALRPEAIGVPTLVIGGASDPVNDPAFAPTLAESIPGGELLMIDGAGHCPQIDQPGVFNAQVIEFLRRNPLARR